MEMTFKQYCADFLNNSKYGAKYKSNETLWNGKKEELKLKWKEEVLNMDSSAKEIVIRSFVEEFGVQSLNALFRGSKEIILDNWNKTQVNKMSKKF